MATLHDIKTPFHLLPYEEGMTLMHLCRVDRKVSKKPIKVKVKKKTVVKKLKTPDVNKMSEAQLDELLKRMED